MRQKQTTCHTCSGTGRKIYWKVIHEDEQKGTGMAQKEEVVCDACDGKGWVEYAVFSVEEAETILKHCGLSTEN